jgi:hypothetical protein
MSIPTETYDEIYQNYSDALQWMRKIGVKFGPDRTQHYQKVVEHWKNKYKIATKEEGKKIFPKFVNSMFEIHDFVDIYKAFNNVPESQLTHIVAKLQKGVNGPINSAEETPKSTSARNFLFEATLAARAHRPEKGVETIFNAETDTGIQIENKKLWIECKRVTSVNKIEANVRKAAKQLGLIFKKKIGSGHRGIVALEVTKLFNSSDQIFVSDNDSQLEASVNQMMDQFIKDYSEIWQRLYIRKNKKIIGTIVRFAFMSTSEQRNLLVHASQWGMNPRRGIPISDEKTQNVLVSILENTP